MPYREHIPMKISLPVLVLVSGLLPVCQAAPAPQTSQTTALYLLPGAPTFDFTISRFREKFNTDNPGLPLEEFRAIDSNNDNLTRAASKINENLYASTALERGTLKIKSMQITWLPIQGPEQKAAKARALDYMAAVIRVLSPAFSQRQSQDKLSKLLTGGKNKRYYTQSDGAIRFVVADNGEKGLTFAVEPIKLTLSESLDSGNK